MKLDRRSPILEKLADLYRESTAGKTGAAGRDFGLPYERLLREAGCEKGEALVNAEADLRTAESAGALRIQKDRRSYDWQRVRVPLAVEAALFALIDRISPSVEREAWAAMFDRAAGWPVPTRFQKSWLDFCHARIAQARAGGGWKPFRRERRARAERHLQLVARLLAWEQPCLLRTASKRLGVDSKYLESSAGTLETLLALASGGAVASLADLGIDHNPKVVRFHGPVLLRRAGAVTDYARHLGESILSDADLAAADALEFPAPRCVTVENATTFHELCRLGCGDLFVHTSYPGRATVDFLRRLPPDLPIHHFGDTDPWGFDVLASLRRALDRPVHPLHMHYRPLPESDPLSPRARRKLAALRRDPALEDVREELHRISEAGRIGDFEQETLAVTERGFPYILVANVNR